MPRNIWPDDHAFVDLAAVDLDVDAQVALDAGDRIDRDVRAHQTACLSAGMWPDRIGNVFTMTM